MNSYFVSIIICVVELFIVKLAKIMIHDKNQNNIFLINIDQ